jgi:hypothetical protein
MYFLLISDLPTILASEETAITYTYVCFERKREGEVVEDIVAFFKHFF